MVELRPRPGAQRHGRPVHRDDDLNAVAIARVGEGDLVDALPLFRAYCDFYEVAPSDEDLLDLSRSLMADPRREGVQLLARDGEGRAVGFATLFWLWTTLRARRLALMNDLFVVPEGRGGGVADALIAACADEATEHGAVALEWQTALDNHRAQAVYDRVGGERSSWLSYELALPPAHAGPPGRR